MTNGQIDARKLKIPGEARLPQEISAVIRAYREIDIATARWAAASGVACPQACGRCCEGIIPEATPAEAELTARWLISGHENLADQALAARSVTSPPCRFYDARNSDHCTIYPVRPFLCRAFGFSGYRDKRGNATYRLCAHMPPPEPFGASRDLTWHTDPAQTSSAVSGAPGKGQTTSGGEPIPQPPMTHLHQARMASMIPGLHDSPIQLTLAVAVALDRLLLKRHLRSAALFAMRRTRAIPLANVPESDPPTPLCPPDSPRRSA